MNVSPFNDFSQGDKKGRRWAKLTEECARKRRYTRPIGDLFRPIFGLMFFGFMAKIGHNFFWPFKNLAIYFRPYFFQPSDF